MEDQVYTDPQEVAARDHATHLLAQIELKLNELFVMLDKAQGPQKLLIKTEIAAQKWHHDMILADCRKKGWL